MATLAFRKKDHKYFLDGEEIPSVSEVTRFLSREVYGEIDPIALDRAAERGTEIHKAIQELDETGTTDVPYEYEGYVRAYIKFLNEHTVQWELIEYPTNYFNSFAGTIDRYGTVDGYTCILDIKTSKTIGKKHEVLYTAAQNLYRMALETEELDTDKLFILHLKPNGDYKLIELEYNMVLPVACLDIHEALKEAKKKRKVSTGAPVQ